MSYNVRSLNANLCALESLFTNECSWPDLLILCETWFNSNNTREIEGYVGNHTIRPIGRSGGISIFTKLDRNLKSKIIEKFSYADETIEINSVLVTIGNVTLIVIGIYRPCNGSIINFLERIESILNDDLLINKNCVITGDININLLNENTDSTNLINLLHSFRFLSCINKIHCHV